MAAAEQTGPAVETLRKQFRDYVSVKSAEIREQREARHYYHGDQWTAAEIAELNRRRQPVVTYNRSARKIDGVIGLLERLRQDPKAYPRTPKEAEGADLGTAVLRYVLDTAMWEAKSPEAAGKAATEGQGGLALVLIEGDHGDPDIDLDPVDNEHFFYDPRSFRPDYSDARYMGYAKWVDAATAKEMAPDKAGEIDSLLDTGDDFDTEATQDRAVTWVNTSERRLLMVDHWYRHQGEWHWCLYSGNVELSRGVSPFYDEKRKTICRYIMFAAMIDHDGDRYGLHRNLKSPQDEINHRRSKALFALMGRRMVVKKGALDDVEKARKEAARADGVIEYNSDAPEFDDAKSDGEWRTQMEMLAEAKAEIDNFGPKPELLGEGPSQQSGRAIALRQQAGIAELGPFILAHKNWKLRIYRAVWNAVQRHWTGERWIRVTDDEGAAQFIQVNSVGIDPATGQPAMVNVLGSLDVDIILDEGPDTINMQADAYEALTGMGPAFVEKFPEALIELAPLPEQLKKTMRDKMRAMEQNPVAQQAQQIQMAGAAAQVEKTRSETQKNMAQAHQAMQPEIPDVQAPQGPEGPKPPSVSIAFGDMPPEAKAQALARAGIMASPQEIMAYEAEQARRQAALRAAQRPNPSLATT